MKGGPQVKRFVFPAHCNCCGATFHHLVGMGGSGYCLGCVTEAASMLARAVLSDATDSGQIRFVSPEESRVRGGVFPMEFEDPEKP